MPTYAYVCTACDHSFEAVQAITDDALTECPSCGGALRKKFHPVGVTFKGSGFYRTDSRSSSSSGVSGGRRLEGVRRGPQGVREAGPVRARRSPAAGPRRRHRPGVPGRLALEAVRPRGLDLVRLRVRLWVWLLELIEAEQLTPPAIACGQAGLTASSVVPSGHDRPFPPHHCQL